MLNFLYAFDKHYNIQSSVSIFSLLENINEKINIILFLDESNSTFEFNNKIKNHKNLNQLIIKYINSNEEFYNLDDVHVSKATFYRLYLSKLLSDKTFNLIYLDGDVLCLNDPLQFLKKQFVNMKLLNLSFGFVDELYRFQDDEPFKRLEMNNDKYFNAGVMLLNLDDWHNKNFTEIALSKIDDLKGRAKFWDQDILNSLVDGRYLSLDKSINFKTSIRKRKIDTKNIIFLHYSGKSKPWQVGGYFEELGSEYHKYYNELYNERFHITIHNRFNSIKRLLKLYKYFSLFKFKSWVTYFLASLIKIFKKN